MSKVFSTDLGELHNIDCLSWLKIQASQSIHCCITSPPYWGLRNYGVDEQLGQEQSPDEYITNLRYIFRELYRVLDQHGSLWLNLGDNYYGGPPKSQPKDTKGLVREVAVEKTCECCGGIFIGKSTRRFCSSKCGGSLNRKRTAFERPKCLLGLPWRVATGLVEDGWILRNDIIWQKPNARPSPYQDRLTITHEHLFHLVKQGVYINGRKYDGSYHYDLSVMQTEAIGGGVKNIGDVWSIKTTPSKDAHFAVFPKELIERPMRATTPEGGLVYDPFMGSGTVAVVAEEHGYRWKGTEISKDYCQIIESKLKNQCQGAA